MGGGEGPLPKLFMRLLETNASDAPTARRSFEELVRQLAVQDIGAPLFHSYMVARAFTAPPGPHLMAARVWSTSLLACTVLTILLVRGRILPEGKIRALLYRVGLFTPMVFSYFELIDLLPALQPRLLDLQLYGIDRALFGETPAILFQRFNHRPIVEWIAFFYYSYFYLMAAVLIPSLFLDRGKRLHELMVGALIVCGGGHIIYTFVPGVGPWMSIPFERPLDGGFWWHQVQVTVANAGAQLDIFPSLHTAYPTYFTLHAIGWRKTRPYRHLWFVIAFFTVNMVTATMFLRWHWGIDVVAGLALATTARLAAIHVTRHELSRGTTADPRMPVWETLFR